MTGGVKWIWSCLPQLHLELKLVNENACEALQQEACPTSRVHMEIQFVLLSLSPSNTQEDLPWGKITSAQKIRICFWVEMGTGSDTKRSFVSSYSWSRCTVCTNACLWLSAPGRAHRNCCWMWVLSWCWSQRDLRGRGCSLAACNRKTAHSLCLERERAAVPDVKQHHSFISCGDTLC